MAQRQQEYFQGTKLADQLLRCELLQNLLVIRKILQQPFLSYSVQEVGLLIVVLGQHNVQHDVAQSV